MTDKKYPSNLYLDSAATEVEFAKRVSTEAVIVMARELLALRKAREGWQLVPVEPDWEMLSADGCKEHHNGQPCLHHDNRKRIWSAMLAASPTPHE